MQAYQRVVKLNPLDVEAWLDYSSIVYEQNMLEEATDIISEALEFNPDAAELHYRMVAYLFASGQYNEALNFLDRALSLDSEKRHILFEYLPQLQDNQLILEIIKKYIG